MYLYIIYRYLHYFYRDTWVAFGFLLQLGGAQWPVLKQLWNDVKGDVAHRTAVVLQAAMADMLHVVDFDWLY